MRHEFIRHCVTLGSALAIGLAAFAANSQAQQPEAEPKQRALISFKMGFLSRFKKDEKTAEAVAASSTAESAPAPSTSASASLAGAPTEVVAASAVEPLPSGAAKTQAVPAMNASAAQPMSAASLPPAQPLAPAPPLALAAAQGEFPSVLPPSVAPVQLASGQYPLPPAGQMPFQTAQSPVVLMMPAGWQPDGNYTFAPRTVMSPEVPAEHWPTSQRNPLGDDSNKGLFNWPQIARKITNSTVGEPDIKPRAPEPAPSTSRALFAGTATSAAPQAMPAQPQAVVSQSPPAPVTQEVQPPAPAPQAVATVEAPPASKALFAPQPKPEPQPEQSKTRALFSLLAKPMNKPEAAAPTAGSSSNGGSRALFAFGQKKVEPAPTAPAPAVVPQYATDTPMPPELNMQPVTPTTSMESLDAELQPPAPPSVANPLPGKLHTVKSDDPKMKWRAKGAPASVVEHPAEATDVAGESQPEMATAQTSEVSVETDHEVAMTEMVELAEQPAPPVVNTPATHHRAQGQHAENRQAQHQPATQVAATVPSERSLLGKQFPAMSSQTPRNTNDSRSPWRRQAERDTLAAAEKKTEEPAASSKAILPNVAAMFPAVEKPSRPMHQHMSPMRTLPANTKPAVTMVAATEDTVRRPHAVQRAHETSARSTDSYYAAPWESEVEAELNAIERRQIGAVSNRRSATAYKDADDPQLDREMEAVERQPRVPFEVDELKQEKAVVRRNAKAAQPKPSVQSKVNSPAGSPSNGARMAEQQSKKSYRRLTSSDVKQKLTRPLAMFGDLTKLPSPLKAAADGIERRLGEQPDESSAAMMDEAAEETSEQFDSEQYEAAGEDAGYDEQPVKPKRAAAKREPVHELRQSTAAAASVAEFEDGQRLTSDDARPATRGQRGGRRQVEQNIRPSRVPQQLADRDEADSGVVTADDAAADHDAEEEASAEVNDERPVRPATHIRNKHGNRVKIFTADTAAE